MTKFFTVTKSDILWRFVQYYLRFPEISLCFARWRQSSFSYGVASGQPLGWGLCAETLNHYPPILKVLRIQGWPQQTGEVLGPSSGQPRKVPRDLTSLPDALDRLWSSHRHHQRMWLCPGACESIWLLERVKGQFAPSLKAHLKATTDHRRHLGEAWISLSPW